MKNNDLEQIVQNAIFFFFFFQIPSSGNCPNRVRNSAQLLYIRTDFQPVPVVTGSEVCSTWENMGRKMHV